MAFTKRQLCSQTQASAMIERDAVSIASAPATQPSKQTAGAAAEQRQEVSSLNLNLSLQVCLLVLSSAFGDPPSPTTVDILCTCPQ